MVQSSNLVPLPLALRLLTPVLRIDGNVKVWLGQLPDQLPIELPILDQGEVTASLQQGQIFTILMQTPQSPLLTQSIYSNRLRALGWLQWQPNVDFNLFIRSQGRHSRTSSLTFCHHPQALTLTLQTRSTADNITCVKLKLFRNDLHNSPCQEEWERNAENLMPIPQLVPPPNTDVPIPIADLPPSRQEAELQKRTAGGTESEWYSVSNLRTSLSGCDLLAHYETQLSQAGWKQQAGEAQDRLWWSAWILHDQHDRLWQLLLNFTADDDSNSNSNHYLASLQMSNLDAFEPVVLPVSVPLVTSPESIREDVLWQFLSDDFSLNTDTKQLWVGQLPPTFSIALELPEQTQVLGSLVRENIEEENTEIILFLTVPLSLDRASEYLNEQLHHLGWLEASSWKIFKAVGFVTSLPERLNQETFNHLTDGSECTTQFTPVTPNCTDIEIFWRLPSKPADQSQRESMRAMLQTEIEICQIELSSFSIPTLAQLDQTEVALGAGNSRGLSMSGVCILTSLPVTVLANHYDAEMQRAGWQLQVTSQSSDCYFSLWSFTDQKGQLWRGVLNLLTRPERSNQYTASLKIF
jgi:hypothetical protein